MWFLPLSAALAAEPVAFDHDWSAWERFLDGAVTEGQVDYGELTRRRADLDATAAMLATADPSGWTKAQRLAAWINAYNAFTIQLVLDRPGLRSIRDIDLGIVFWTRRFALTNQRWTLASLENQRVRAEGDGRIHAAINCASVSCLSLSSTPFRAETLEAQLDDAARTWCATHAWRLDGETLYVSRIFSWFSQDFASYAKDGVPGANAAQSAAVGFCEAHGAQAPSFRRVAFDRYDWALNGSW